MSSWFKTSSTSQSSLSNTTSERPASISAADTRTRSLKSSNYFEPKQNVKVAGVDKLMTPAAAAAYYRRQVRTGSQLSAEPSPADVGVRRDASDTAATLATRSDLTPKLWYREKSSETANEAALLAQQTDLSPEIWKPDFDQNAATAATQAKDRTPTVKSIVDYDEDFVRSQGRDAATKIAAVSGREYASRALPEVYSWRDNERMYTLPTSGGSLSEAGLAQPSPEFLASLESKARENARKRLSQLYVGGPHLTKEHHLSASQSGALFAANGLNADDPLLSKPQFLDDAQKQSLISKARLRAANEIAAIEFDTQNQNFLINKSYPDALKIAEEHSKKRLENHGKIDMGGGKFMTQSEVEAIAERNVRPVLDQISEKASKQRQEDEERRAAEEAERQKRAEEKKAAADKKAEEKRIIAEQKAEERRIKQEEKAVQKAEKDKVKAAQKAENEKKRLEREQRAKELRQERLAEKEKTKHEKLVAAEQRKQEKIKLQSALEEARQAEAIAAAESSRLRALKQTRQDELEAAKLAEEQAEGAAREQAEKDVAEKEAALAEAIKKLNEATNKEKESHSIVQSAAHSVFEAEEAQSIADEAAAESSKAVEQEIAHPEPEIADTESINTVKGDNHDQPWQMVDKKDASQEAVNGVAEKEDHHAPSTVPASSAASTTSAKKEPVSLPSVNSSSKPNGNIGGWFKRQASKVKGQRNKVLEKQKSMREKGKEKVQELIDPESEETRVIRAEKDLPVANELPKKHETSQVGESSAPAIHHQAEETIEDEKPEKLIEDEKPEKLIEDEKEPLIEDESTHNVISTQEDDGEEEEADKSEPNGSVHNEEETEGYDKLPEIDTSKLEIPNSEDAKRASIFTESVA